MSIPKENREELIGIVIVLLVFAVAFLLFIVVGQFNSREKEEYCRKYGIRTVGFRTSSSAAGRSSERRDWIEFVVDGKKYESVISPSLRETPSFNYGKLPVIIAYDKKDPSRNLCIPEEEFEYKGKMISYEQPEGVYLYYMKIKWKKNNKQ